MAGLHSSSIVFLSLFFFGCLVCTCTYASFITHQCSDGAFSDQTALMDVFSDLVSASSATKSRVVRVGAIHASFHCWRNTPSQGCKKCVESATKSILRLCPNHQNATVWNSDCTLQYITSISDHNNQDNIPWAWWYTHSKIDEVVTNKAQFDDSLNDVMSSLIEKATTNTSRSTELFATGEVIVTIFDTLYGMVECSSSETKETCRDCLWAAMARATSCCRGSRAAEVILPRCRLGYDLGPSMSRASLVGPFSASSFSNAITKSVADAKKK